MCGPRRLWRCSDPHKAIAAQDDHDPNLRQSNEVLGLPPHVDGWNSCEHTILQLSVPGTSRLQRNVTILAYLLNLCRNHIILYKEFTHPEHVFIGASALDIPRQLDGSQVQVRQLACSNVNCPALSEHIDHAPNDHITNAPNVAVLQGTNIQQ